MTTGPISRSESQANVAEGFEVSSKGQVTASRASSAQLEKLVERLESGTKPTRLTLSTLDLSAKVNHQSVSLDQIQTELTSALSRAEQFSNTVTEALITVLSKPSTKLTAAKVIAGSVAAVDLGVTGGALMGTAIAGILIANTLYDLQNQKRQPAAIEGIGLATGGTNAVAAETFGETVAEVGEHLLELTFQLPEGAVKITAALFAAGTEFASEVGLETTQELVFDQTKDTDQL